MDLLTLFSSVVSSAGGLSAAGAATTAVGVMKSSDVAKSFFLNYCRSELQNEIQRDIGVFGRFIVPSFKFK